MILASSLITLFFSFSKVSQKFLKRARVTEFNDIAKNVPYALKQHIPYVYKLLITY
jgi:hypothetical protein